MADAGGDHLHKEIAAYTPVRTGTLRASWYRVPTVQEGKRHKAHVRSDLDYAVYVNYPTGEHPGGSGRYPIVPRKPGGWLHWVDPLTGADVFRKRVMHPGSAGAFMVEKGAHNTEAAAHTILQPELEVFIRELEAQIASAG